ncbi:SAM-dependent methyltransferase [Streptacidiphilus sp. P02-A3a]|uniref:SAM-dependent methyltransferase n=1 Tax=Streptacidiphilus sp. P02-A3a TaxID=2704468 RepID=UPI0015F8BFCA|nr:SAM-dependent methyltransferase [Streptacidiphilus sp. P02-A3a]QMU69933.1 SAM-dependent methyltransferase [Streptacidiphilus sp. P02-A3a]
MTDPNAWMKVDAGLRPSVDLRTDQAHSARVYDYLLGGKDNFPADRAAGDRVISDWPRAHTATLAARACMHRITRRLAEVHGVRQFFDIGTGIPTAPNLHEIAQGVDPACRVVYVDNDPIVLAHARALLTSAPEGRTAYIDGDLRDVGKLLVHPVLHETLDLTRPVALTLINILHFYSDEVARPLVEQLVAALPSGSFLAVTTGTADSAPDEVARAAEHYRNAGIDSYQRTRAEVERFFTGLELDTPGVALANRWHPDGGPTLDDSEVTVYAGIARKP